MAAEAAVFVDVDGALRQWTRDAVPSVNRRVFFGAGKAALPQITVQRLTGRDEAAIYTFHVWAEKHEQAAMVAAELATAIEAIAGYTHDGVLIHGGAVQTIQNRPDPRSARPRFVVDATFAVTAAA
jgi:hypothetical protein